MTSKEQIEKLMIEWRKHIHQNPETAFEEFQTSEFVAKKLEEMGIEVTRNVGKTGVVGTLKVGDSNKVIGLRADMDAINVKEMSNLDYKSKNDGKMHACGHDGHTAMLLGAAKLLSESKNFNGIVRFIFQPAEEPGKGSKAMVEEGLLEKFPMDEIYGIHNRPNYKENTINVRKGSIMSSEDNFKIVIKGKGTHASSPQLGIDPLVIAAQIILGLQTIVSRNVDPFLPAVISCTEIFSDGAHNALPSNVTITGDTRSNSQAVKQIIEKRMKEMCMNICAANNAECEFEYTYEFEPTVNWDEQVDAVVEAATKVVGKENVDGNCLPWSASEDFGYFLTKIPGAQIFLGSGTSDNPDEIIPLHNSTYDYNDNTLIVGAKFYKELIENRLK